VSRRNGVLVGAVLAVAAAAAGLVVVLSIWNRQEDPPDPLPQPLSASGIAAQTTFSPRLALFGDTVRAHVDVVVDTTRIDPDSVRVAAAFMPWEAIARPERVQREAGDTGHVRTTFVLRCLTGACILTGQSARLEFEEARISFLARGTPQGTQAGAESAIRAAWPPLLVYPRFAAANLNDAQGSAAPWRADLVTLPAASYRITPGILVALLLAGAAIAAIAAIGLAYVAWPRRDPAPLPEPEPELPPEPALSPLEQALALLEESVRVDGAEGQRRALELVAEELELAQWGDPDLARTARVLAWSEGVPPLEETSALAARVRSTLPEPEHYSENGDGRVV
jgi:hypothetical protein